ncbi:hypothetical protein ACQ4PT_067367 [Festuca glaucescens]
MGVRSRRQRKIARRDTAPAATHRLPDELLELVFLRLPLSLQLVLAACTCKRWRRIVADGGFLRRFRSLHPHAFVVGHYRVGESTRLFPRPPGRKPVFFPSSASPSSETVDARHFSLDFLPARRGAYWDLADSRGGILLFLNERIDAPPSFFVYPPDLVVCDPLTRRHSLAGTLVFSSRISANGDGWTLVRSMANSGMPELTLLTSIHYAGHTTESVYWITGRRRCHCSRQGHRRVLVFLSPKCMPNVSDKATRIRVFGGEDGPVHIAVLTKHFLKVFVQAEDNSQWVEFLAKETTVSKSLTKRTTSESN